MVSLVSQPGPLDQMEWKKNDAEHEVSKLEATFAQVELPRRPNSIIAKDVWRHTKAGESASDELEYDFSLTEDDYPLQPLRSLQDVFPAVLHKHHLAKLDNFAEVTELQYFDATSHSAHFASLDSAGLVHLLNNIESISHNNEHNGALVERLLVFFVPLEPQGGTSFGSRIPVTQADTSKLFSSLHLNSEALLNVLGRPDYWSPQSRWEFDTDDHLIACDVFSQLPRWNLQFQGSPVSTYLRYDARRKLTTYVISHKENDSSILTLRNILRIACATNSGPKLSFLQDPFDIVVILSTLSHEVSKHHYARFRRHMWQTVNKVDDHLAGLETSDRTRLGELTKALQIISQQADSHLLNCDVAIITAACNRDAQKKLHNIFKKSTSSLQPAIDAIDYVIASVEKQKKLFLNYKNRKDSTMNLVYNLVTQQDAAANIQLAASMKRDSTSMNGIAALTMTFLPGTFTASVLSAGIFSAAAQSNKISVSNLWWLWLVITVPLTAIVLGLWYMYKWNKDRQEKKEASKTEDLLVERRRSRIRTFSFATLAPFRTRESELLRSVS